MNPKKFLNKTCNNSFKNLIKVFIQNKKSILNS